MTKDRAVFCKRKQTWRLGVGIVAALVFFGGGGVFLLVLAKLALTNAYCVVISDPGWGGWIEGVTGTIVGLVIGAVGLASVGTLIWVWTYAAWRASWPDEVLILSQEGIWDGRLSKEVLPWDVVITAEHSEFGPWMVYDKERLRRCNLSFSGKLALRFPGVRRDLMHNLSAELEDPPGALEAMVALYPGD